MKKTMLKILSAALVVTMLFGCCVTVFATSYNEETQKTHVNVVTLGDSVAFGLGLHPGYDYDSQKFWDAYQTEFAKTGNWWTAWSAAQQAAKGTVLYEDGSFGWQLANKYFNNDEFEYSFTNYSVSKYFSDSVLADLYEDSYNSLIKEWQASFGDRVTDYRKDIPYEQFIGTIKAADVITIDVGFNDVYDYYQELLGSDYRSYYTPWEAGASVKDPEWMYKVNPVTTSASLAQFQINYYTNIENIILRLKELNPNAQVVFASCYNVGENIDYMRSQMMFGAFSGTEISDETLELVVKYMKGTLSIDEVLAALGVDPDSFTDGTITREDILAAYEIMMKLLALVGMNSFGQSPAALAEQSAVASTLDADPAPQAPAASIDVDTLIEQYATLEASAASYKMFDRANEILATLTQRYGYKLATVSGKEMATHVMSDNVHPNVAGHLMIADAMAEQLDMDALRTNESNPVVVNPIVNYLTRYINKQINRYTGNAHNTLWNNIGTHISNIIKMLGRSSANTPA